MDLDIQVQDDTVHFTVVGPIDTEGGAELTTKFMELADSDVLRDAIFDLSEVPTITSAGIGKLLKFYKHLDRSSGSMKIEGISEVLRDQFREVHLDQVIPIAGG